MPPPSSASSSPAPYSPPSSVTSVSRSLTPDMPSAARQADDLNNIGARFDQDPDLRTHPREDPEPGRQPRPPMPRTQNVVEGLRRAAEGRKRNHDNISLGPMSFDDDPGLFSDGSSAGTWTPQSTSSPPPTLPPTSRSTISLIPTNMRGAADDDDPAAAPRPRHTVPSTTSNSNNSARSPSPSASTSPTTPTRHDSPASTRPTKKSRTTTPGHGNATTDASADDA